ncbi:hypothetical protein [Pseudomonas aeruginosa]|uniref:Uncharacterized protein n=2 Tax=root TaxID=1 RepID=H2BDE3_9CAUD|nr:hypothetical protein [Pseudomonas aeruginosa]YP_005098242.1 hypothetical protein PMG1_00039 [Pseudomonas phage PMG1]AEX55910.1 hypothetical protein PMG1_00039 [Pseudomonas phage PMG1]MBI8652362.1 hypothetical protein [Pseudomonas aeruginosa]MBI8867853.1 hypothetical protein [Pseudomonas aeruginosa]OZO25287.1 hypothetical protein CGU43_04310 [Pseudomonas aeruginosa]RUG90238.1 hypothetical protein IPC751_15105 [Pseudomonas aeruginosa]
MHDMREEFEAWASSHFVDVGSGNPLKKGPNGHYGFYVVATAWKAWQASRAALKVELPERAVLPEYTEHRLLYCERTGFNDCLERVKEALQQAGIEVAP